MQMLHKVVIIYLQTNALFGIYFENITFQGNYIACAKQQGLQGRFRHKKTRTYALVSVYEIDWKNSDSLHLQGKNTDY